MYDADAHVIDYAMKLFSAISSSFLLLARPPPSLQDPKDQLLTRLSPRIRFIHVAAIYLSFSLGLVHASVAAAVESETEAHGSSRGTQHLRFSTSSSFYFEIGRAHV